MRNRVRLVVSKYLKAIEHTSPQKIGMRKCKALSGLITSLALRLLICRVQPPGVERSQKRERKLFQMPLHISTTTAGSYSVLLSAINSESRCLHFNAPVRKISYSELSLIAASTFLRVCGIFIHIIFVCCFHGGNIGHSGQPDWRSLRPKTNCQRPLSPIERRNALSELPSLALRSLSTGRGSACARALTFHESSLSCQSYLR